MFGIVAGLKTKASFGLIPPGEVFDRRNFQPSVAVTNNRVREIQELRLLVSRQVMQIIKEKIQSRSDCIRESPHDLPELRNYSIQPSRGSPLLSSKKFQLRGQHRRILVNNRRRLPCLQGHKNALTNGVPEPKKRMIGTCSAIRLYVHPDPSIQISIGRSLRLNHERSFPRPASTKNQMMARRQDRGEMIRRIRNIFKARLDFRSARPGREQIGKCNRLFGGNATGNCSARSFCRRRTRPNGDEAVNPISSQLFVDRIA